jgi:hypothetical protein
MSTVIFTALLQQTQQIIGGFINQKRAKAICTAQTQLYQPKRASIALALLALALFAKMPQWLRWMCLKS